MLIIFLSHKLWVCICFQYIEVYAKKDALLSSGNLKTKSLTDIVATVSREEIPAGQTFLWENVPLAIPPLPPSRLAGCNIIHIAYAVKVRL